jgi:hypothetical protein
LQVVLEAAVRLHAIVQRILSGVPEGRVTQVVREADRFGESFVQLQRTRDGARDLRDLDGVRQARPVEVALVIDEHLRLVNQAPERGRMDDAIAIPLILAAQHRCRLGVHAAARGRLGGSVRSE